MVCLPVSKVLMNLRCSYIHALIVLSYSHPHISFDILGRWWDIPCYLWGIRFCTWSYLRVMFLHLGISFSPSGAWDNLADININTSLRYFDLLKAHIGSSEKILLSVLLDTIIYQYFLIIAIRSGFAWLKRWWQVFICQISPWFQCQEIHLGWTWRPYGKCPPRGVFYILLLC